MSTVVKDLGPVTAYAYAVAGGYTGTEEEFTELLGDLAATVADLESLTVTVTTLTPGSSATASYEDGVLALGIPQGAKGDTGTAATIAVGTVTTVAPTQNASVTNTGSSSAAVFAFSIPRGDGVATVTKTGTSGNVDTYTMTSDRGVTLGTFTVTNGNVSSVNGKTGAVVLDAGDLGYDGSETYSGGTVGAEVAQLKSQISNLTGAIDDNVNYQHELVNYGYNEPYSYAGSASAIAITRNMQVVTLNGGPESSNRIIKLNGSVQRAINAAQVRAWTATMKLLNGHEYAFRMVLLSGTMSNNGVSTSVCPGISIYASGESSTSGTVTVNENGVYERRVTGDDGLVNVCIYVSLGRSFTNAKFLITATDLALHADWDFDYFNTTINSIHNLVDYGYKNLVTDLIAGDDKTMGTSVGVRRYGTYLKLNYAGSSDSHHTKRVRVSGTISRVSGGSTYKNWEGNLQLKQGTEYRFLVKKLSGTAKVDDNDYIPVPVVYETGTANSLGSVDYTDGKTVCSRRFTAPEGPVTLALYLTYNAVLTDFAMTVTLEELESGNKDYYVAELNDTIAKVRNETTSPALVFPWVTDIHRHSSNADAQIFDPMIRNISALAKSIPCDFVLDTGDLTDGNSVQATTLKRAYECLESFMSIGVPYVWVNGNHDTNYAVSGHPYLFTIKENYKAYFTATEPTAYNVNENGTDYYVDFAAVNTRLIVLNANNTAAGVEYVFGSTTATWLADALDTDMNVIVTMHQSPYTSQVYGNISTTGAAAIRTTLESFVSNGGNLMMISGHSHLDVAFVSPFVSVMQDCNRFNAIAEDVTDEDHDITGYVNVVLKNARAQYTASEDLWTVCVYKPDTNELSLIRFGAGYDRYFHVTHIAPTTLTSKLTDVTWSSSNEAIATVSDGEVTGVATGTCAILAKDATGDYECWIVDVE